MRSPCKNCPYRFVGCHIQCPQYRAYVEDNTAIRERDSKRLKTFEVRKNDRDFQVNDILILREWSAATEDYTGLYLCAQISYILDDPRYCKEGYVILGLKFIEP